MKSSDEIETTENKVVKKVVVYAVMVALVFINARDFQPLRCLTLGIAALQL